MLFFTPVTGAIPGSVVTSDIVVSDGDHNVSVSAPGVLVVNGSIVATPYQVQDGDELQLQTTASLDYSTPIFIEVETGGNQLFIWFCQTQRSPEQFVYPGYATIPVFSIEVAQNNQGYLPNNSNNGLYFYDTIGSSLGQVLASDEVTTTPNTNPNRESYVLLDFKNKTVTRVDSQTLEVEAKYTSTSKVASGVPVPSSLDPDFNDIWVTQYDKNKVGILDYSLNPVSDILVGTAPLGIAYVSGLQKVVVCCSLQQTLSIIPISDTSNIQTVAVEGKPYSVVASTTQNKVYVSFLDKPHILVYDLDTQSLSYISTSLVTNGELAIDDNYVYFCSNNIVGRISVTNHSVIEYQVQGATVHLTSCALSNSTLYVTDVATSKVRAFTLTLTPILEFSVPRTPYSIACLGNTLAVSSLYTNSPNTLSLPDLEPTSFDVVDYNKVPRNFIIETNEVQVGGIDSRFSVKAWLPSIYSANLIVNSVVEPLSSNGVLVNLHDLVKFEFSSPIQGGKKFAFPLIIGNKYDYFVSETHLEDTTPSPFTITPITGAVPGSYQESSEVVIAGIDPDVTILIIATGANLIKNSIPLGVEFTEVTLGDTIALSTYADTGYCSITQIQVEAGLYYTTWNVATAVKPGLYTLPHEVPLWELPTIGGAPLLANHYLVKTTLDLDSLNTARLDVANSTPVGFTTQETLVLLNPVLKRVYLVGIDHQLQGYVTLAGTPIDLGYFPKVSELPSVETRTLVITKGPNKLIVLDNSLGTILEHNLSGEPLSVVAVDYNKIVISYQTHYIEYVYDVLDNSITAINTFPAVRAKLFSYERTLFVALQQELQVQFPIGSTQLTLPVGAADIAFSLNYVAVADTWNNKVALYNDGLQLQYEIELEDPPTSIALGGTNGDEIYYNTPLSSKITHLDGTGTELQELELDDTVVGVQVIGSSVFSIEIWGNLDLTQSVSTLTGLSSASLPIKENATPNSVVESDTLVIKGLVRPTTLVIDPVHENSLSINGGHPNTSGVVFNGDEVVFSARAPLGYYNLASTKYGTCSAFHDFFIRTLPNLLPDLVYFNTLYDVYLDEVHESTSVVIQGLTPGFSTTIEISSTTWQFAGIFVNDELQTGTVVEVTNGDLVRIVVIVAPAYGEPHFYSLSYLDQVFGTFKVVSLILDGAEIWPTFGVNKFGLNASIEVQPSVYSSGAPSFVQYSDTESICECATPGDPITYSVLEPQLATSLLSEYAGDMLANSAQGADTYLVWALKEIHSGSMGTLRPNVNQVATDLPGSVVVESIEYILVNTWSGNVLGNGHRQPEVELVNFFTFNSTEVLVSVEQNYGVVTSVIMRMTEPSIAQKIRSSFLFSDLVYQRYGWSNIHFVPHVYEYGYHWLAHSVEAHYQEPVVNTTAFYTLDPSSSSVLLREILKNNFDLVTYNSGYRFEVDTATPLLYIWHTAAIELQGFQVLGARSHDIDLVDPTFESWAAAARSITRNNFSWFKHIVRIGVEKQSQSLVRKLVAVEALGQESPVNYSIGLVSGYSWQLDVDQVSLTPPYTTCVGKGLYSTAQDAYYAAVVTTNAVRPLHLVEFKDCFLWTIDPERMSVECRAVGPNDPYIIPMYWNLSMGPLRIAKVLTKESGWKHGG